MILIFYFLHFYLHFPPFSFTVPIFSVNSSQYYRFSLVLIFLLVLDHMEYLFIIIKSFSARLMLYPFIYYYCCPFSYGRVVVLYLLLVVYYMVCFCYCLFIIACPDLILLLLSCFYYYHGCFVRNVIFYPFCLTSCLSYS